MKKPVVLFVLCCIVFTTLSLSATAEIVVSPEKPMEISFLWWGGESRHELFNRILDMYEDKYPGLTITRIYGDYNGMMTKMATMAASNSMPDCFGMTMMKKPDFAGLDVFESMNKYIENGSLNVSNFTQSALSAGMIDGELVMLTWGDTCFCTVANKTLIESVGMELPNNDMTLDDYYDYCVELQSRLPDGYYATALYSADAEYWFEAVVTQLGYSFISEDGLDLGFPKELLKEWYNYQLKLYENGLGPDADTWADNAGKSYTDRMEASGRIALYRTNLNQVKTMQTALEDELAVFRSPYHAEAIEKYTDLIQPSAMCINKNCSEEKKEVIIAIYNDFVNSKEMQEIFNLEWGVPGSSEIQEYLLTKLDENDPIDRIRSEEINLYALVSSTIVPSEGRKPGTAAMLTEITNKWYEILFNRMSVDEAVDAVYDSAWTILG